MIYADNDMVVMLFAASALDGEFMGLVVLVGKTHFSSFEDGYDGGVVVEHGKGSLLTGDGD